MFSVRTPVTSPCVGICQMSTRAYCVGCGRVIEEIAGWSTASTTDKLAIRERAAQRLRDAGPPETDRR